MCFNLVSPNHLLNFHRRSGENTLKTEKKPALYVEKRTIRLNIDPPNKKILRKNSVICSFAEKFLNQKLISKYLINKHNMNSVIYG